MSRAALRLQCLLLTHHPHQRIPQHRRVNSPREREKESFRYFVDYLFVSQLSELEMDSAELKRLVKDLNTASTSGKPEVRFR